MIVRLVAAIWAGGAGPLVCCARARGAAQPARPLPLVVLVC